LFEVNFAARETLLSADYFSTVLDENDMNSFINDAIVSGIGRINSEGEFIEDGIPQDDANGNIADMSGMLAENIGKSGVLEQMPSLLKGFHAYVTGDADKLPTVDIKTLKEVLLDAMTFRMIQQDDMERSITAINALVKMIDGQYKDIVLSRGADDAFINQIAALPEVKQSGLNTGMVKEIVKKYPELSGREVNANDVIGMMKDILKNTVKYENIKDNLDLNLLLENAFKNSDNPLSELRLLILSYKTVFFRTLVILIGLLLLAFIPIAFGKRRFIRWIAGVLSAAGIVGILAGLSGLFLPSVTEQITKGLASGVLDLQPDSIAFLRHFIRYFLTGYFRIILLEGMVLLTTGILVIAPTLIFHQREPSGTHHNQMGALQNEAASGSHKAVAMIARILVFMILALAVQITLTQGYGDFSGKLEKLASSIEGLSSPTEEFDLLGAIAETTGADFLNSSEPNAMQAP
jgi:hypothetical protein